MEIIIITSIVVAVFGAVALIWVLSQGAGAGDASSDDTSPGTTSRAEDATDQVTPEPAVSGEAASNPAAPVQPDAPGQAEQAVRQQSARQESAAPKTTSMPPPVRPRTSAPERSAFDGIAVFAAAESDQIVPPIENIPTPTKSAQPEVGPGMALNIRPGVELAVPGHPLRLNAIDLIASQIEILYEEYVRLDEERSRLAQELLTNMLFEKIERTAGRLEIVTEQATLDLRKELIKVSAEYDRVQFRLGSLQHLNARLGDPRVAHQIEELVVTVRALAGER